MYRFSRAIFVEIKDLVDPHPETVSAPGGPAPGAAVLRGHDRAARPGPALLREAQRGASSPEIRHLFSISDQVRVYRSIDRHIGAAVVHILDELERAGEGAAHRCRATTRKGKPCQRTPLPDREYCPSHQHLEERLPVTA